MGKLLKFILFLVIVAILAGLGYECYQASRKYDAMNTAMAFTHALAGGDFKSAAYSFPPDSDLRKNFQAADSVSNIPVLGDLLKGLGGAVNALIGSVTSLDDYTPDYKSLRMVNGNGGIDIYMRFYNTTDSGSNYFLSFHTQKIDGTWYLSKLPDVATTAPAQLLPDITKDGRYYVEKISDKLAMLYYNTQAKQS